MKYLVTDDLKRFLLKNLGQVTILEYYLELPVQFLEPVCSPLRVDKHPTCSFFEKRNGKIIFHDFAGWFSGDCLDVVQEKYNIGFNEALKKIYSDFYQSGQKIKIKKDTDFKNKPKADFGQNKIIRVRALHWNQKTISYWNKYLISKDTLKLYQVYPCKEVWLENNLGNLNLIYTWNNKDPGFCFYFGNGKYKIYFPNRRDFRFISNTDKSVIQGFDQLPDYNSFLVVTKALKDVMCFKEHAVPAIAPNAESITLNQEIVSQLKNRFHTIYVNGDNDRAGKLFMKRHRDQYDFIPVSTKNQNTKDFADLCKENSFEFVDSIIDQLI